MEKELQKDASANSTAQKRHSTPLIWTKQSLLKRLAKGPQARAKFVESQISDGIAFQIRALRGRKRWSQPSLAEKVETTQNQIYRLENPITTKPTITTLKKVAAAFDVALVVRFVPFSQLIDWVSGTPRVDKGLSTGALAIPSFDEEVKGSVFREEEPTARLLQLGIGSLFGTETIATYFGEPFPSGAYAMPPIGAVTGLTRVGYTLSYTLPALAANPPASPFKLLGQDQSKVVISPTAQAFQQAQEKAA